MLHNASAVRKAIEDGGKFAPNDHAVLKPRDRILLQTKNKKYRNRLIKPREYKEDAASNLSACRLLLPRLEHAIHAGDSIEPNCRI